MHPNILTTSHKSLLVLLCSMRYYNRTKGNDQQCFKNIMKLFKSLFHISLTECFFVNYQNKTYCRDGYTLLWNSNNDNTFQTYPHLT